MDTYVYTDGVGHTSLLLLGLAGGVVGGRRGRAGKEEADQNMCVCT
jgi:hypothetical protein